MPERTDQSTCIRAVRYNRDSLSDLDVSGLHVLDVRLGDVPGVVAALSGAEFGQLDSSETLAFLRARLEGAPFECRDRSGSFVTPPGTNTDNDEGELLAK